MGSKLLYPIVFRLSGYIVAGVTLVISAQVAADPNPFYGSVSAVSGVSDNALKTEEESISEKQRQYALSLGGKWENSLLDFDMGYAASKHTFSEDSQKEKTFVDGKSSLLLGKQSQPVNLLLTHARNKLLSAPDSLNLTQNQDEKDSFSARPTLRQQLSGVDSLLLNGEYTRIKFAENEFKNSQREGGSLVLDHKFSALDSLDLSVQQTSVDFKLSPYANYKLSAAALAYKVQLRKLSYSLRAGANKTSPEEGEDYSSPSYGVSVTYNSGGQLLVLDGSRQLTDTSAGAGDILPKSELPTSDGGVASLDQIERTSYSLSWSTFLLCQRCSLVMGASQVNDDYLTMDASAKEQTWNIGFSYALSSAAKISTRYLAGDNSYTETIIGRDYKIENAQLEFSYQINRDFGLTCSLRKERRDNLVADNNYTETFAGAGLNYKF